MRWPAPLVEASASIVFAMSYAMLAGLQLPTRRALVMIGILLAATWLLRRARPCTVHEVCSFFAVIALLVFDPLCVLSAGFWLSFVGVAWLMFCTPAATANSGAEHEAVQRARGRQSRLAAADPGSSARVRWWGRSPNLIAIS